MTTKSATQRLIETPDRLLPRKYRELAAARFKEGYSEGLTEGRNQAAKGTLSAVLDIVKELSGVDYKNSDQDDKKETVREYLSRVITKD